MEVSRSGYYDVSTVFRKLPQLARGQVRNAKAMLMTAIKEQWHPEKYKTR